MASLVLQILPLVLVPALIAYTCYLVKDGAAPKGISTTTCKPRPAGPDSAKIFP